LTGKPEAKETTLKDPDLHERIILKWIFRKWHGDIDWIELAQDRDKWQALVTAVMKLRFT
jgi:predicted double-glycine peptidase